MAYREALDLQGQLVEQRQEDLIPNTVLLLEHPPVITLGARKTENRLLVSPQVLVQKGIELVNVRRGGGTTAHNPGQVVLYPVLKLQTLGLAINEYVRDLESIGIELLGRFGVECHRRKGYPGLWTEQRKIASIGVQLKHWVSMHGMAINVSNDLGIFGNIVPCGLEDVEITSVSREAGRDISVDEVKDVLGRLCVSHWSSEEGDEEGDCDG